MRVFITGVSGFIGSHLAKKLNDEGHVVVGLVRDYLPLKWLDLALKGSFLVRGDVRDFNLLKRVLNDYQVDWCIHLAAKSIVGLATKDPVDTFSTNILGTVNVLEACRQLDVEKTHIQSTDKVYSDTLDATEESPLKATEPYSASKVSVDVIAQAYMKTYGMKVLIPRSCNVFGLDYSIRIIPNTVRSCLRGESPVIYEGEQSARQYIYIDDEVETLTFLMEQFSGVVNIPGHYRTQGEVVMEVLKHFPHLTPRWVKREAPKEIVRQSMKSRIVRDLPRTSFERGIALTVESFKEWT